MVLLLPLSGTSESNRANCEKYDGAEEAEKEIKPVHKSNPMVAK